MGASALTIQQPWAELILRGDKRVEVRSWDRGYRGLLWLHAGKAKNAALVARHGLAEPLDRGCYVGAAVVAAVVRLDRARWSEWRATHHAGSYRPHHYGWLLTDVVRFPTPIPGRGQQLLFTPGPEVEPELEAALAQALG